MLHEVVKETIWIGLTFAILWIYLTTLPCPQLRLCSIKCYDYNHTNSTGRDETIRSWFWGSKPELAHTDWGTTWKSSVRISSHQAEISTWDFLNTEQEYSHSNMLMSSSCYQTHDLHHCHHEVHIERRSEPVQSSSSFSKINFNIIQFTYLLISHDRESNKMDQCGLASMKVEWPLVLQNSHQVSWKYVSW